MKFRLHLICCGRDEGYCYRATWQEADELRESYVGVDGHERTAILEQTPWWELALA